MTAKIKNDTFSVIRVTGDVTQFGELKRFCGDKIHIEYASCCVDDYWNITLDDDLRERSIVVPDGDYIVRYFDKEDDRRFTVVSSFDIKEMFEITENHE